MTAAGNLQAVIHIRIDTLHKCIRYLDIARFSDSLQLRQKAHRVSRMFKDMRGNHKIECTVLEWQIFNKTEYGWTICSQWHPMAFAGCLICI
ncbi:MAG: hypothetical protein A3F78_15470 [Burkholderiales bacterium RIFCSPLOWO2_12_FULL_61_40]|nr:MAG: hypothetical protein A3F78_15470 [Burkholderiales bacterium RIFCSPLOWO2_12_FULL_61_40]